MVRRPDKVRRRWSGISEPDLFGSPARPAAGAARTARPVPPLSAEALERVTLQVAEVFSSFEARQSEAAAARADVVAAAVLSRAEVVELLELGIVFAVDDKARQGFKASIRDVDLIRFHGRRHHG